MYTNNNELFTKAYELTGTSTPDELWTKVSAVINKFAKGYGIYMSLADMYPYNDYADICVNMRYHESDPMDSLGNEDFRDELLAELRKDLAQIFCVHTITIHNLCRYDLNIGGRFIA